MQEPAQKIVILGGGTAGWMAACLMAKRWMDKGFAITLIESTDIGAIGVGEGSTPPLKEFFRQVDIAEEEWMPECNATYKNGIRFEAWGTKPGFERFFHPFPSRLDSFTLEQFEFNTQVRRRGVDVEARPDKFFLACRLADGRMAPVPSNDFPFSVDYSYHFDSILLGGFLRKRMVAAGVEHIDTKIVDVNQDSNGDITSLKTEDGELIHGDFFVDCTGFLGLLIQKTLEVPFISFSDNLYNDAAVAIPSPIDDNMLSETISTAVSNGWIWKIPLQNRYGNGYVYSSDYISRDAAETELRTHAGLLDSDEEARHIPMRVGRLERNWCKNCVAIGLSQGFIEPLEASGIQIILHSITGFIDAWEDGGFTNEFRDTYNKGVREYFEGIRDFIVLHYKSTSRADTQYWLDNFENPHLSDSLRRIIECWLSCGDLAAEIKRQDIEFLYPSISWHSIFAGMGIFPDESELGRGKFSDYKVNIQSLDNLLAFSARNFEPQGKYLTSQSHANG